MLRQTIRRPALRPVTLYRSFHITPKCREEATEAEQQSERKPLTPKEAARRAADEWLKDVGMKYYNQSTPVYVSEDRPFPMNPLFRPRVPLSEATRQEIFKLYLDDPKQWTPRALAESFGLSIVRVQAILRLKALQKQWEKQNKPLQTELTQGMESLLRARTLRKDTIEKREALRSAPAKRLQPFFRMMNEEEAFTAEDAATLMQQEPYANLQRKLDEAADHVFELEPPKSKEGTKIISRDGAQKSRFQFMIVDTGKVESPKVYVRDKDGQLRNATVEERFRRKNQKAQYIM